MWKTLFESVKGVSHQISGLPCQDNCSATELNNAFLLLACADGAGGAELSHIGARCACETIIHEIAKEFRECKYLPDITRDRASNWLRSVRDAIALKAKESDIPLRQLATTLLAAIIGENRAAFIQIGDGAIVSHIDDTYQVIFWPQNGEYANTTYFVTDDRFEREFEFAIIDARMHEVAMFTDGLQMLALDFKEKQAHRPFFEPMFQSLRTHNQVDELIVPMRTFLDSTPINERTDDDKTLVLASRVVSNDAPL